MKSIQVEWQGQTVTALVHKTPERVWVHLQGETYTYEPESLQRRKKSGASAVVGADIVAPMPGKITKLSTQEGASVTPGQVLVVMEAMKMEYTLKAKLAGQVTDIACQVGDQVTLGQVLVKIHEGAS